jgi:hypothetical protein
MVVIIFVIYIIGISVGGFSTNISILVIGRVRYSFAVDVLLVLI